jgi:acyl-CoA thioesterase
MTKVPTPNLKGTNPFGHLIGLDHSNYGPGWNQCTLKITDQLLNPNKVLHGGVIYSMADTGMGAALYTDLDLGEVCTTVEIKISYFKAVTAGTLVCESKIINRGRKIATLESEIKNNERLVAKASGSLVMDIAILRDKEFEVE